MKWWFDALFNKEKVPWCFYDIIKPSKTQATFFVEGGGCQKTNWINPMPAGLSFQIQRLKFLFPRVSLYLDTAIARVVVGSKLYYEKPLGFFHRGDSKKRIIFFDSVDLMISENVSIYAEIRFEQRESFKLIIANLEGDLYRRIL